MVRGFVSNFLRVPIDFLDNREACPSTNRTARTVKAAGFQKSVTGNVEFIRMVYNSASKQFHPSENYTISQLMIESVP